MLYRVWSRRNTPDAVWADMPYAPRARWDAESLIDYYEREWGNLYEYVAVPCGMTPHTLGRGMCEAYV